MNSNKNVSESKRVGKAVKAKKKQCYINAMRVIWYVPEYEQADYVEGYAVTDGNFCIEHGWVEQDGVVIDPTLHDDGIAYFPGLRFTGGLGDRRGDSDPQRGLVRGLADLLPVRLGRNRESRVSCGNREQRIDMSEWRTWRCGTRPTSVIPSGTRRQSDGSHSSSQHQ